MKIMYLLFHGFSEANGITNKVFAQIKALRQLGHEVALCHYDVRPDGHKCRMMDDEVLEDFGTGRWASLRRRCDYGKVVEYVKSHGIELVYIRSFHNSSPFLNHFVKQLDRPSCRVIMEIPTYPYDQECSGYPFSEQMELRIDRYYRKALARHLYRIVTFTDEKTIFGAPTICISNGIDLQSVGMRKEWRQDPSPFHLLGVAELHPWHGYDRLIAGLGEYYRKPHDRDVNFHIAGRYDQSTEYNRYLDLIKSYGLEDHVTFCGPLFGEGLDEAFEWADFAIASLGRHRSGISLIRTLKNREYAARGIPFIYSECDPDFDHQPYVLKAPADESPIDIKGIIDFYRTLRLTPADLRATVSQLDWQVQMKHVIDACS